MLTIPLAISPPAPDAVKYARDLAREEQDADREDDRDDAGLVDPQRQEGLAPPWYIRRPRTRDAYWIGIRRWPSWM
jgi:hypothetical protein